MQIENPGKTPVQIAKEQAETYPMRALSDAFCRAGLFGQIAVAEILRAELKRRSHCHQHDPAFPHSEFRTPHSNDAFTPTA